MRQHGWFRPHVRGLTAISSTTLREGGGDIITSIFADGTDGFYFDFSKTDRLFQAQGGALADSAGENISVGLESHAWAGRTLAAQIAQASNLIAPFVAAGTGWSVTNTDATHKVTFADGSAHFQVDSSSPITALSGSGLTAGNWYSLEGTITEWVNGALKFDVAGTSITLPAGNGSFSNIVFKASTANLNLYRSGAGVTDMKLGNLTVKPVLGNHGLQATTSAQPKYQTGGLARFDGSDDHLLTAMKAASAMSLVFKCKASAANGFLTGVRASGTNDRFYLGFDGSGQLHSIIGDSATGTITRSGSLVGTTGVAALSVPGDGTAELFWNGVSVGTGSGLLAINLTQVFAVGGLVIGGTPQSFINGDIYHALAIKKALTAAQIAAITNKWGTS